MEGITIDKTISIDTVLIVFGWFAAFITAFLIAVFQIKKAHKNNFELEKKLLKYKLEQTAYERLSNQSYAVSSSLSKFCAFIEVDVSIFLNNILNEEDKKMNVEKLLNDFDLYRNKSADDLINFVMLYESQIMVVLQFQKQWETISGYIEAMNKDTVKLWQTFISMMRSPERFSKKDYKDYLGSIEVVSGNVEIMHKSLDSFCQNMQNEFFEELFERKIDIPSTENLEK